jgi:hypothetical protein
MGIPVRAIERGYYGHFRDPHDDSAEFEVEKEADLADWMERLDGKGVKRHAGQRAAPQTTGNNPIGGKPTKQIGDLPDPADIT